MKRILTSAFAILLATAAVQAQSDTTKPQGHRHGGMERSDRFKDLKLSEEQQTKMNALRDDFKKQSEALRDEKLTDDERRTKVQALRQQRQQQIDAILTPEQKATFDKQQNDRNAEWGNGGKRGGDSAHFRRGDDNRRAGAKLQKALNLTSDQKEKMSQLRSDFHTKAQALRNDQSLTQDQKRTQLRSLMQQQQEQMKNVLTKEQQEKWQQLRKEHRQQNS